MTRYAATVSAELSREEIVEKMSSPWKLPKRLRLGRPQSFVLLLLLLCAFAFTLYLSGYEEDYEISPYLMRGPYNTSAEINDEYLLWNSKCHMLSMDPYESSISQFVKEEKFEACSKKARLTSIFRESNGSIYLLLDHEAVKDYKDLYCCWAPITRPKVSIDRNIDIDSTISVGACKNFENHVLLNESEQIVLIICRNGYDEEAYKNIHTVINPKHALSRLKSNKLQKKINAKISYENKITLSVLMLGLDSVSRLNFYRTMPITRGYFEEQKWIELRAYNKMGDNTFPNLMAILTGQNETMSNSKCNNKLPYSLQNCPMIWYNFRDAGYATAYGEDCAEINTFNNAKSGFVEPPTDYYLRPYVLATEKLLKIRQRFRWPYCTGPELSADRIFDAAADFTKAFMDQPYFGFFWSNSLSHESMNGPSLYDSRFLDKLKDMETNGAMNDSVIIVLSDHGMRYGDSRDTFIGWYEERLPFAYIWLPRWFRDQNPEVYGALLVNQDRLTSPYDLHETLRDILQRAGGYAPPSSGCPQCSSLFKPVPSERGCKDAGISSHWCTCTGFESIGGIADTIVLEGAKKFVDYVNNVTEQYKTKLGFRLCSKLKLRRIIRARKVIDLDDEKVSNEKSIKLFYSLELTPGGGKFETTIVYHGLGKYVIREEEVSRINLYGHDAICLEKGYKKYCQCRLKVAHFILKWF